MNKCSFCGAETQLYDNGTPVCVDCISERSIGEGDGVLERKQPSTEEPDSERKLA